MAVWIARRSAGHCRLCRMRHGSGRVSRRRLTGPVFNPAALNSKRMVGWCCGPLGSVNLGVFPTP